MPDTCPEIEIEAHTIVALGSFNPAIFQPLWFSNHHLIRQEEAENAKIQIIQSQAQVAVFETEWFSLQAFGERFALESSDPTKHLPLRDLARGTFQILEHTPIRACGFNRHIHFRIASEEEWHEFGHHYAPKESWHDLLVRPGLRSLTIQGTREECSAKRIEIKVEPSAKVHPGVFIHVNQHYNIEEGPEAGEKDRILVFLAALNDEWASFVAYAERAYKHLWAEFRKNQE